MKPGNFSYYQIFETTNLPRSGGFMGAGPRLHLIEKFTRISADELRYEVTIDDPDTWTAPWTAQLPLRRSADRLFEYACHEGNETVMKKEDGLSPGARPPDAGTHRFDI
jgi:hypothetical protein